MHRSHSRPASGQVFTYEAPVAVVLGRLAAEQRRWRLEIGGVKSHLDLALGHQPHEALLVMGPGAAPFFEVVQEVLSGSQKGLVLVARPDKLAQEEGQILGLCEAGELR